METSNNYPQQINDRALEIYNALKEVDYIENDIVGAFFLEKLTKFFFDKWIDGQDDSITTEQCEELYGMASIDLDVQSLIDQGYAGIFEDDNGSDILFLTEKGKQYVEQNKNNTSGI